MVVGFRMCVILCHCAILRLAALTTQPKDRCPPEVLFSVPVGVHAFKIKKKDKQEKEGDKQGTSHLAGYVIRQ